MLNLKNVTFLLPMQIDNKDRLENFNLCVSYLNNQFDTNIIVGEQSKTQMLDEVDGYNYIWYDQSNRDYFHRTKIFNDLCRESKTDVICLYDSDVFLPRAQYVDAYNKCMNGCDMVIPYDGTAYDIPRVFKVNLINAEFEKIGIHNCRQRRPNSIGGAIFFNKKRYVDAGMENEKFKSWGGEDDEILRRFNKLGYTVTRTEGYLMHLIHQRGEFSKIHHKYYKANIEELKTIGSMTKTQLRNYVDTWAWKYD